MSFVKEGITFYEPSDLSVIAWNPNLYLRLDNRSTDQGFYLAASDLEAMFAAASHNNHGEYLRGSISDMYIRFQSGVGMTVGRPSSPICRLVLGESGAITLQAASSMYLRADSQWLWFQNVAGVQTTPANTGKNIYADGFILHACTEAQKSNKVQIVNPGNILAKTKGITYTQNGIPGAGVTFEDLEKTEIPGAVTRDGKGNPLGVNLLSMIPVLIEEVKALRQEVEILKKEGEAK